MQCRAAAEPDPMKEAIGSPTVGKLDMSPDTETFQEVMAFTGPAPERINGRLAMIGFVATAAAEAATHKSALEQIQIAPIKFTITMFLISLASLIPKYASGTSLAAITQACSRDGMPPQLR
eukprot:jgi/Astpho2/7245/fgenesh1_pg.00113_%23_62_t